MLYIRIDNFQQSHACPHTKGRGVNWPFLVSSAHGIMHCRAHSSPSCLSVWHHLLEASIVILPEKPKMEMKGGGGGGVLVT